MFNLFRSCLRACRNIDDTSLRQELKKQVLHDFKQHTDTKDNLLIRTLIQEGNRNLKQLQSLGSRNNTKVINDDESWLSQKDPEDERGRVGKGWPFSK